MLTRHMNNRILCLSLLTALLLTGCSGAGEEAKDSTGEAPQYEAEQIVQRFVKSDHTVEAGEIYHPVTEYYEYNGKAYWHNYEYFTGVFVESDGAYTPVLNEGETLSQAQEYYPIVELMMDFDPQDYSYVGSLDTESGGRNEFYLRNDGELMLHICDVPAPDVELSGDEKTVAAEVLTPTPLPKE